MLKWIRALDRVLKGEATSTAALRTGRFDIPLGGLSLVGLLLGVFYGVCMGVYAVITRFHRPDAYMGYQQLAASAVKVPLLFFLTLVITLPSLYVFNALVGSRLSFLTVLRLLVAALGVMLALLASFGTILVFFTISTSSYSFMVLLNVVMFAVSGMLGLAFLLQTLHRLSVAQESLPPETPLPQTEPNASPPGETPPQALPPAEDIYPPLDPTQSLGAGARRRRPGPLDRPEGQMLGKHVRTVFRIWVLVFGLVGAQMGWVLRPFIGTPNRAFTFLRPRESNFFEAVYGRMVDLVSPDASSRSWQRK